VQIKSIVRCLDSTRAMPSLKTI